MIQYIPEKCPHEKECYDAGCVSIEKHPDVHYICAYPFRESQIKVIKKWNESIKKISQIDEFALRDINRWHINKFRLYPNMVELEVEAKNTALLNEAKLLMEAGFDLGFNESHGVGDIVIEERGIGKKEKVFVIELWQNRIKQRIIKDTLDEVIEWIIYFHNYRNFGKKVE